MTKLRTLSLACLLALVSFSADARTRFQTEGVPAFDRHAVDGMGGRVVLYERATRKVRHSARGKHHRHVRERTPSRSVVTKSDHLIVAASGAKTSVSIVARPHFVCLLTKLEAVGYRVDFMGGYASRGNSSAHPTGNALDINQTSRNVVTRRLPGNITELARGCGLVHGAVWSNPDQGHFEMPRKYGYVHQHRRTRYASAR